MLWSPTRANLKKIKELKKVTLGRVLGTLKRWKKVNWVTNPFLFSPGLYGGQTQGELGFFLCAQHFEWLCFGQFFPFFPWAGRILMKTPHSARQPLKECLLTTIWQTQQLALLLNINSQWLACLGYLKRSERRRTVCVCVCVCGNINHTMHLCNQRRHGRMPSCCPHFLLGRLHNDSPFTSTPCAMITDNRRPSDVTEKKRLKIPK